MERIKVYIGIIVLLVSSIIGINTLLNDTVDNREVAYALDNMDVVTTTTEEPTTITSTTTTVITSKPTVRMTTTTKHVNTLSISGYNRVWNIKVDDTYKALTNGNSYGIVDNRLSFSGRKMIIYGHSFNKGGGLFNYFQNYDHNKSFYDNHKYIFVTYNNKKYTYEIFSVYTAISDTNDGDEMEYYNVYNYYSNYVWNQSLQVYKKKSDYDTGVSVNGTDRILIIQTCSTNPAYQGHKYSNILIMGKLIKEE